MAHLAGVSPITVSRALRTPELVAAATRARIETAVADTGYVPDLVARSFRSSRSGVIAAVVPSIDTSQYAEMLQGVSDELRRHHLELMVGVNGLSLVQEEKLLRAFIGRRPEGVVLSGTEHTPATRAMLARAGIPVVETGSISGRPLDMKVGYSEEKAVAALVAYLHRCGYRRIGFVCGPLDDNERAKRRRKGYLGAVQRLGLAADRIVTLPAPAGVRSGAEAFAALLERWPDTDCALCSSDIIAVGALFECQRRGWPVPDRIGLAGFLGLDLAAETVPPLTTVKVARYDIGREAAALLLGRLAGAPARRRSVDLGFTILPRQSTRPPRGG
ncbi:MAG TPA: LacI family DNA-binding transcriptional regulator [Geminicoccaceae bacterium]|nr:LacI family DNA-binding transcriptional regulator [Geminicoccaceae bacterium]